MMRLAVLISNAGKGTNLQAIIDAIKSKKLNAQIEVVISSNSDAYGLTRAKKNNIPFAISPDKKKLLKTLSKYNFDFICLAGWRQIVLKEVIDAYPNRILNLHPGLVPDKMDKFVKNPDKTNGLWNRGKLTQVAIANFLNNNATYAGSSIHFLTDEFDFGKVLSRAFEKIKTKDNTKNLYKRLKIKENKMYVDTLIKLCNE